MKTRRKLPPLALDALGIWKEFLKRANAWQSRILLSMIYYILLGPTGLVAKLVGHDLVDTSWPPRGSAWHPRTSRYDSIERLRSQS